MRQLARLAVALGLICGVTRGLAQGTPPGEVERLQQEVKRQQAVIQQQEQDLKAQKRKVSALEEDLAVAQAGTTGDVVDPNAGRTDLQPWTEYQRREPWGALFVKPATLRPGECYARISHVGQRSPFTVESDAFDDLLAIERDVKVGLLFGYGLTDRWDLLVQRTNGREGVALDDSTETVSYDLWDVLTKVQVLREDTQLLDLSVVGGITYFWQNDDRGEVAADGALLAERSFWRLRLGSGLLYTSLSTYEKTYGAQDGIVPTKRYPREEKAPPAVQSYGSNHTLAVPVTASFAVWPRVELFGEAAFPVDGFDTKGGPAAAAGLRFHSHSHTFNVFLGNTSNNSFNSTLTGGYKHDRLDIFGFAIGIHF